MAVQGGFRDLVSVILANDYSPSHKDNAGKTPIFYAVDSPQDNADVLEELYRSDKSVLTHQYKKKNILEYCLESKKGKYQCVQFLISTKPDLMKCKDGNILHALALQFQCHEKLKKSDLERFKRYA